MNRSADVSSGDGPDLTRLDSKQHSPQARKAMALHFKEAKAALRADLAV